jgi:hypothetical protein
MTLFCTKIAFKIIFRAFHPGNKGKIFCLIASDKIRTCKFRNNKYLTIIKGKPWNILILKAHAILWPHSKSRYDIKRLRYFSWRFLPIKHIYWRWGKWEKQSYFLSIFQFKPPALLTVNPFWRLILSQWPDFRTEFLVPNKINWTQHLSYPIIN